MEEDGTTEKIRNTSTRDRLSVQRTDNDPSSQIVEPIYEKQNEEDLYTNNISTERFEDTPLDFSLRKRYREDETSSSESLNSPSSSTSHIDNIRSESENSFHSLNGCVKKEPPDKWDLIGEPRTTSQSSHVSHSSVMLPPYSTSGMFYHSASNLSTLPSLTSLVDSKYINQNARPNSDKHSSKSPSPSGIVSYANPGYIPGLDSSVLQNLNLSPDELLAIYRQQLNALKEQDKYLPSHSSRPRATPSPSPSFTPSSVPSLSPVHHHSHHRAMNNIVSNGSSSLSTHSLTATGYNSTGSRKRPRSLPDNQKDEAYWERRRKNNDAAKRSRDARRAKEDEIAIRAAILEQENLKLRVEVAALKTETAKLRCLLYNS